MNVTCLAMVWPTLIGPHYASLLAGKPLWKLILKQFDDLLVKVRGYWIAPALVSRRMSLR